MGLCESRDRWKVDETTGRPQIPSVEDVVALCKYTESVLAKEPTLLKIDHSSCYIVGDIHGNYHVCTESSQRTTIDLRLTT